MIVKVKLEYILDILQKVKFTN